MATSEAQKRASAKYRKNNVKAIMFNLYPSDSDLIEFLEGKELPAVAALEKRGA